MRLNERLEDSGAELIYAPRDENRYITSAMPAATFRVDRRVSQERRLIRKLKDSLYGSIHDSRKQALYDKVSSQHKLVMDHIVADLKKHSGIACSA